MKLFLSTLVVLASLLAAPSRADNSDKPDQWIADLNAVFEGYLAHGKGNYGAALQVFRPAAEQGNTAAQSKLGEMYEQGHGVPQDYVEALKWYRRADDQGDETANMHLALMYYQGKGVPQDFVEAIRRFRLNIERGYWSGMDYLAGMYRHGIGVPQDYVQAHMWFNISAATLGLAIGQGRAEEISSEHRDKIAKLMTRDQIAEAQRMAREWLEAHPQ